MHRNFGLTRKNFREGGKKIADKNWILTAYDKEAADNGNRVTTKVIEGKATPHTASADKGSEKPEKKQEKQSVFDKAKEIADKAYSQPATAKLLICRKKTSFGVSKFSFLRGLRLILC